MGCVDTDLLELDTSASEWREKLKPAFAGAELAAGFCCADAVATGLKENDGILAGAADVAAGFTEASGFENENQPDGVAAAVRVVAADAAEARSGLAVLNEKPDEGTVALAGLPKLKLGCATDGARA